MPEASAVWEAAATWDGRREDGKESVWDYPRPPVVVRCERRARVELGGECCGRARFLPNDQEPVFSRHHEFDVGNLMAGQQGKARGIGALCRGDACLHEPPA